jgi:hypothetical protein
MPDRARQSVNFRDNLGIPFARKLDCRFKVFARRDRAYVLAVQFLSYLDTNDATGKLMLQIIGSMNLNEASCCRGSWKASPRPRRKANIAAASPRLAPRLNRSSPWLTLARREEKRGRARNQHPQRLPHLTESQRCRESASCTAGHSNADTSALIGGSLRFVGRGHVDTIRRPFDKKYD